MPGAPIADWMIWSPSSPSTRFSTDYGFREDHVIGRLPALGGQAFALREPVGIRFLVAAPYRDRTSIAISYGRAWSRYTPQILRANRTSPPQNAGGPRLAATWFNSAPRRTCAPADVQQAAHRHRLPNRNGRIGVYEIESCEYPDMEAGKQFHPF